MFRSARREIVFPQAEHARLAATIALVWGNERLAPSPLPRDRFVTGVAEHDRGYAPLDADGIGEVEPVRCLEIQRESFRPRGRDPVIDLVVAMHVRRLIGWSRDAAAGEELTGTIDKLREQAGVSRGDAERADLITNICDRVSFDFCFEAPAEGTLEVPASGGDGRTEVAYAVSGDGTVELDPWPLGVPRLTGLLVAYAAATYPDELVPTVVQYELIPGRS